MEASEEFLSQYPDYGKSEMPARFINDAEGDQRLSAYMDEIRLAEIRSAEHHHELRFVG